MIHGEKFTHDGRQYTYYAPDKPVIFDPPVEALVWDNASKKIRGVLSFDPRRGSWSAISKDASWSHMAIPAPDDSDELMTNEELAELLACGYGVIIGDDESISTPSYKFLSLSTLSKQIPPGFPIKRFRTTEWIKPTKRVYREFMAEIGRDVK